MANGPIIEATLGLDTTSFQRGLDNAKTKAGRFGNDLGSIFGVSGGLMALGRAVGPIGLAVAGIAGAFSSIARSGRDPGVQQMYDTHFRNLARLRNEAAKTSSGFGLLFNAFADNIVSADDWLTKASALGASALSGAWMYERKIGGVTHARTVNTLMRTGVSGNRVSAELTATKWRMQSVLEEFKELLGRGNPYSRDKFTQFVSGPGWTDEKLWEFHKYQSSRPGGGMPVASRLKTAVGEIGMPGPEFARTRVPGVGLVNSRLLSGLGKVGSATGWGTAALTSVAFLIKKGRELGEVFEEERASAERLIETTERIAAAREAHAKKIERQIQLSNQLKDVNRALGRVEAEKELRDRGLEDVDVNYSLAMTDLIEAQNRLREARASTGDEHERALLIRQAELAVAAQQLQLDEAGRAARKAEEDRRQAAVDNFNAASEDAEARQLENAERLNSLYETRNRLEEERIRLLSDMENIQRDLTIAIKEVHDTQAGRMTDADKREFGAYTVEDYASGRVPGIGTDARGRRPHPQMRTAMALLAERERIIARYNRQREQNEPLHDLSGRSMMDPQVRLLADENRQRSARNAQRDAFLERTLDALAENTRKGRERLPGVAQEAANDISDRERAARDLRVSLNESQRAVDENSRRTQENTQQIAESGGDVNVSTSVNVEGGGKPPPPSGDDRRSEEQRARDELDQAERARLGQRGNAPNRGNAPRRGATPPTPPGGIRGEGFPAYTSPVTAVSVLQEILSVLKGDAA